MREENIVIIGAREHNLKNVSIEIPKYKMIVFTGMSGSGKSSLVFDTVYAEAQRQLLDTFSSYARSRLPKIAKPDVDEIKNLSVAIIVDQKRLSGGSRSTVGTITEIYTYLRLLFSRIGEPLIGESALFSFNSPEGMCSQCQGLGKQIIVDENSLVDMNKSLAEGAIKHPDYKVGSLPIKLIAETNLFDMEKPLKEFTTDKLNQLLHSEKTYLEEHKLNRLYKISFEGIITSLKRRYLNKEDTDIKDSNKKAKLSFLQQVPCHECQGTRLNKKALSVKVNDKNIAQLCEMELTELQSFLDSLSGKLVNTIVQAMQNRLQYLIDIGVGYLSLNRTTATLSGGESQRVKMAKQLGCNLVDLIYILDEPSTGLHPRDVSKLLNILKKLRDLGNTVLVVEHDPTIIESADYVIDVGPRAGVNGGQVVFQGIVNELKKASTITAKCLINQSMNTSSRRKGSSFLEIDNANLHNLKNVSVKIPKKVFVCVTGVAGSGKSTLINNVLAQKYPKAIKIDQSPVGRSSRSNPATYTKVFDIIRKEFSSATGRDASLFSFNSKGACPRCKGLGVLEVEMHFLESVTMICPICQGKRYQPEILDLKYKGKNISQVLQMTAGEAINFFENREIKRRLKLLEEVGLEYLELGQSLSTLSGGEAQRIKIVSELHNHGNIYIMDEPTTGLHMADIERLIKIINKLVDTGNTVVVIEHNLDVIKSADWIIDLGPEGGSKGGTIIAQGTPEAITKIDKSYTGEYLKAYL
ncbi:excinuclease ABC subunit UvrA [Mastigocoleus sp. MO_188.B34]|uniref:excinuclease ABC subunit UvrA n=1 Tax=Mastigocoleus sp. MO_188.B34 TaxID=3036635 RepID=UPI002605A58F|nr:excinuclease ABC subunit UvrA [Mastigocoleus sp. MO_188.B34]MDJ0694017.1 excinuclease ABC subunit UvrA [Mastigocoleus sp. MO_188.B34]